MLKVLIVDDEAYIADSLYYFFKEQEQLDLDVYRCYHADDAIDMLSKMKFSIVITDIYMPDKNGIALLSEIKRMWADCRVIILSGYSKFDYAYQVLQYSHVTYLLKTEGYDKLLNVVEQTKLEIEQESVRDDIFMQLQIRLENSMPTLQREFLERLFYRRLKSVSQTELNNIGSSMQVQLPVALLLVRIDSLNEDVFPYNDQAAAQMVLIKVDQYISSRNIVKIHTTNEKELYFIFQDGERQDDGCKPSMLVYLQETLPVMQNDCTKSGVILSVSLSSDLVCWEKIPQEYIRIKRSLNTSLGLNRGVIIDAQSQLQTHGNEYDPFYVSTGDIQRLSSYLRMGKRDEFLEEFKIFTTLLRQNCDMNDDKARECYLAISFVVADYISQYCGKYTLKYDVSVLLHPERLGNWAQGVDLMLTSYLDVLDFMEQQREKKTNWVVLKVHEYIQANYMNDLSLTLLSDYVHFNASYLSRFYKEVTGSNIQDYIKDKRLEMSKEYLAAGNLRISDVARKAGFNTSKYFITVFKKDTGMTPNEWRDSEAVVLSNARMNNQN